MNSTVKTQNDAAVPGITFDVPDDTIVAAGQPMRIKVTYLSDGSIDPVHVDSKFILDESHGMVIYTNEFDSYFRDPLNNIMSAYINVWIMNRDDESRESSAIPTVSTSPVIPPVLTDIKVSFGGFDSTLTLNAKDVTYFSEHGFAPAVDGSFIKDLSPVPYDRVPDLENHEHVKITVTAVDASGAAIPNFQVPLNVDISNVQMRMFPVDKFDLANEIHTPPSKYATTYYINTGPTGSRDVYVFVGRGMPGITGSSMELSVNIPDLSLQYGNNEVLVVTKDFTKAKAAAPIILDMDGDSLDPSLTDDPNFAVAIPEYSNPKDNDIIYLIAKDSQGNNTYLGLKRIHNYDWGVAPLFYVPYSAFPSVGNYYLYYYISDATRNITLSQDLFFILETQVPNLPTSGNKTFKQPVEVYTMYGLEIKTPPGAINEYAIRGGLNIHVPVKDHDPTYVGSGQLPVVKLRTQGWTADGRPKSQTKDYRAQKPVSVENIADGFINVYIIKDDLTGYDSNSDGRPGTITFEYYVDSDKSVAWYGKIDTVAPGKS